MAVSRDKPATLKDCFQFLDDSISATQYQDIKDMGKDEVWQLHFSLSPLIRDEILSGNEALSSRLEKSAFCDDPDYADQIAVAYWDYIQSSQ